MKMSTVLDAFTYEPCIYFIFLYKGCCSWE